VKNGGAVQLVEHALEITVEPEHIPEFFEVSVAGLQIGDALEASAIKLPAGARLTVGSDATIVTIVPPMAEEAEEATAAAAAPAAEAKPKA
jgi:large subunit ribosomal protein L25